MSFETYVVKAKIGKFLSHNGQTADPLNRYSKAMKQISGKRNKTDADHEALAKIEKSASVYLTKDGNITIDTRVIEAAITEGAKTKEGKLSLSAVFVDSAEPILINGKKLSFKDFEASAPEEYILAVPVRIGTSKIIRTRALFENVELTFNVSLDTSVVNAEHLQKWIVAAFNQVGIGDWRPRYGRGNVISIKNEVMN